MIVPQNMNEYARAIVYRKLLQQRDVVKTAIDVMFLSHILDRAVQQCGFKLVGGFMMEDVTTLNDAELETMLTLNNGWLPFEVNLSKASRVMGVSRRSLIRSYKRLEASGLIVGNKVQADYLVLHGGFFEIVDTELSCELRIVYSWMCAWCDYHRTDENNMTKETLAEILGLSYTEVTKYLFKLEKYGKIEKISDFKNEYHGIKVKLV